MVWWQLALLVLVTSVCTGGLLLLRGRIQQVNAIAAGAATPAQPASLAEGLAELATVRAEWKAHQKQLDAYLEAFEDIGENVERKRRRIAARDSKQKPEDPAPGGNGADSVAAARARARAQGISV